MFTTALYISGFQTILIIATLGWLLSLWRKDVSHVDSLWAVFLIVAGFIYAGACVKCLGIDLSTARGVMLGLLFVWGIRLSGYITWRNWGKGEDHRYASIRKNNEPGFAFKSLYIIFGLQAVLAWVVSLPLLALAQASASLNTLGWLGAAVVLFGIIYETVADAQLARFKANAKNKGKVMDQGLWRYSRHPNYFGEFCVWWGFYGMAFAVGGWWTVPSALLMSFLLLKFSGVALLDKAMVERKPKYADYIKHTNAFFPGLPKGK